MTVPRPRTVPALIGELVGAVKDLEPIFSVPELDVMERGLQIAAAKLRGMRNSVQPINRLAPELLSKIFSEAQVHLPSFLPLPPSGIHDYQEWDWCNWLLLLQVCRHWRGVIASSPALWSVMCSSTNPMEFIRRSHGADLTVYLGVRFRGFPASLMEALAPHTSRFKEFHMLAEGPEDVVKLKLFSSPAPRLHSLMIEVEGREDLSTALPPIFAGRMPKLRQLALGYFTSWPKGYFHNLTHLALYNQKENSWSSTSEFLDFLEYSPRIEELALVRGGPMRSSGTDVAPFLGRLVSLKRLQRLSIGEWPSALIIARLLSHLSLPRRTELYIWGNIFHDQEDIGSILPRDTSHLHNLKGIKEWCFIRQSDPTYITFKLIAVVNSTLYMTGGFHHSQIQASAISRYPLNKVRSLKLREDPTQFRRLRVWEWKAMFRLVPALKTLAIFAEGSPQCTRAVVSALRPAKSFPPLPSLEEVICPALKTMEITEELDLPFLHICSLAAERLACGGPKIDFTFRGCSRPRRGFPARFDSDSDSELEYGFDFVAPGTHMQSVKYVKFEGPVRIAPTTWPTQAFNWAQGRNQMYFRNS
ncbi:hypothetical protein C8R44DRAFT_113557 [Mycena epipterygia]|nr:hypothetical protein C8R44DRAFT_113557 [Mycena epipterygia]